MFTKLFLIKQVRNSSCWTYLNIFLSLCLNWWYIYLLLRHPPLWKSNWNMLHAMETYDIDFSKYFLTLFIFSSHSLKVACFLTFLTFSNNFRCGWSMWKQRCVTQQLLHREPWIPQQCRSSWSRRLLHYRNWSLPEKTIKTNFQYLHLDNFKSIIRCE